ncbi:MAG: lipid A export permease/ATP-binding protein MsbA [Alphaproteobacteria bacterium]|nr:lipid A export permease/ATP-binding protein MsbA [Alphaproteobacteria bacterium]
MSTQNTRKAAAVPNKSTAYMMKRLVGNYLKPYLGLMKLAIVFMLIVAAMTAALAWLMQPVMDDVLGGDNVHLIMPFGFAIFLTFALRGIAAYVSSLIMAKVGHSIVADIQKDLFAHFLRLDLSFFHANPSGQLISRVVNDVNVVRAAVTDTLTGVGRSALTLVFLIGVMFYQDWKLAIAAFVIFPFAAGAVVFIGRRLRKVSRNIQHEFGNLTDRLSQIFQGVRQVQAYGMERAEVMRANTVIERVKSFNIKSIQVGNLSTPINELLIGIVAGAIIAYGGYQIHAGEMTTGQLVAFLTAFTMAYEPMKKLAKLNNSIQMGMGAAERIFTMLDVKPAIKDRRGSKPFTSRKPSITFSDVEFAYADTESKALNGISFVANAGKVTALVGPSGGGKSTIINLIPRFYEAQSGVIRIGRTPVDQLKLASLREHISLVSQDITIFDDTIATNIAYGRPDASREEIIEAARKAAADEFIQGFPNGYETQVGEDGVKLSGGQRQRIAIARALLRDAPILLLDEATSALDNESEKAVQEALEVLEKGRTTVVIAHRLSTVQNADQIIVLDEGTIAERGTHDELMKKKGLYKKMYQAGLKD